MCSNSHLGCRYSLAFVCRPSSLPNRPLFLPHSVPALNIVCLCVCVCRLQYSQKGRKDGLVRRTATEGQEGIKILQKENQHTLTHRIHIPSVWYIRALVTRMESDICRLCCVLFRQPSLYMHPQPSYADHHILHVNIDTVSLWESCSCTESLHTH